jgi:hypothetical protein
MTYEPAVTLDVMYNNRPSKLNLAPGKFGVMICYGKKKNWDHLHITGLNENFVGIQGLYTGHYADIKLSADMIIAALQTISDIAIDSRTKADVAEKIQTIINWNEPV